MWYVHAQAHTCTGFERKEMDGLLTRRGDLEIKWIALNDFWYLAVECFCDGLAMGLLYSTSKCTITSLLLMHRLLKNAAVLS